MITENKNKNNLVGMITTNRNLLIIDRTENIY